MRAPEPVEPPAAVDTAPEIEIARHEEIEVEVPAPLPEPPANEPPQPKPPTSVDELEEEMARLLSELSGQPRR